MYVFQANGLVEDFEEHGSEFFEDKQEEWDTVLDCCISAYNTFKHAASLYSPFEIMYERKAVLPVEFSADEDTVAPELQDAHVSTHIAKQLCAHVFIINHVAIAT